MGSNSGDDKSATKLSDLQLVAYTTRRRQVKFEKQCKTNFGGEKVAGGMCVQYSVLKEICVVAE